MSADELTLQAIQLTRSILERILSDPEALVQMTGWEIAPESVEETIADILEYLEKTREKEAED